MIDVRIGWAEFDAAYAPGGGPFIAVSFAEFDVQATPFGVYVGWCEFDVLGGSAAAPVKLKPTLYYAPGEFAYKETFDIPHTVDDGEEDEEAVVLTLMMEIAKHVLL